MTSLKYCCSSSLVKLMKSCLGIFEDSGSRQIGKNCQKTSNGNVRMDTIIYYYIIWEWQPDVRLFTHQFSRQRLQNQQLAPPSDCPATPRSFDQRTRNQKCRELQPERPIYTRSMSISTAKKLCSTHPKKGGNVGQPVIDFQGDITRCDPDIWWTFGT